MCTHHMPLAAPPLSLSSCFPRATCPAANKTVFNIEYKKNNATFQNTICPYTHSFGLTSIRKELALYARPWDACYAYLPTSPPPVSAHGPAGCCPGPSTGAAAPWQEQRYKARVSPHTHLRPVFVPCSLLQSSPPASPPPPPPVSPPPPPAVGPNIPALKSCTQGLAIPSYFYPGAYWAQAKAAKAKIMIINPNSGPGAAVDANYVNTVADMKAAGGCAFGCGCDKLYWTVSRALLGHRMTAL